MVIRWWRTLRLRRVFLLLWLVASWGLRLLRGEGLQLGVLMEGEGCLVWLVRQIWRTQLNFCRWARSEMVKGRMLRGPGVHRWWIWVGRKRGLAFARVCDLGGTLRTGDMTAARVGLDWRGDLVVAVFEEQEGANGAACLRSDRSAGFRDGSKKKKKKRDSGGLTD
jgi:hypothetical protein